METFVTSSVSTGTHFNTNP